MDSSVSPKDEIWFLRVYHHFSTGLYHSKNFITILKINFMGQDSVVVIAVWYWLDGPD